jgi:cephalosporin hydroxylase
MTIRRAEAVVRAERRPGDPTRIRAMAADPEVVSARREWMQVAARHGYSYNFSWMGVPIIQHPEDIVIVQELLWETKPDLVIETGIAFGGSLLLSAGVLRLLDGEREVLGVDVDIREHTRAMLASHPLAKAVSTIEGDSTAPEVVAAVAKVCQRHERVLVILDSNHTCEHVAAELTAYGPFVSPGSYLIVMDTVIAELPADYFADRPWDPANSPLAAVQQFLQTHDEFRVASEVNDRLLASSAPGGYLIRAR